MRIKTRSSTMATHYRTQHLSGSRILSKVPSRTSRTEELMTFVVGWEAGASAQIELFSPGPDSSEDSFRLRYSAPFRTSLRPPLEELTLGEQELDPIRDRLNSMVSSVARGSPTPRGSDDTHPGADDLKLVGNQ